MSKMQQDLEQDLQDLQDCQDEFLSEPSREGLSPAAGDPALQSGAATVATFRPRPL